jgi:hypothetical protein
MYDKLEGYFTLFEKRAQRFATIRENKQYNQTV